MNLTINPGLNLREHRRNIDVILRQYPTLLDGHGQGLRVAIDMGALQDVLRGYNAQLSHSTLSNDTGVQELERVINLSFNEQQPRKNDKLTKDDINRKIAPYIGLELSAGGVFGENLAKKTKQEKLDVLNYLLKKYTEKNFVLDKKLEEIIVKLDGSEIFSLSLHSLIQKITTLEINENDEKIPEAQEAIKSQLEKNIDEIFPKKIAAIYEKLSALATHRYAKTVQTNAFGELIKELTLDESIILLEDMIAVQSGTGTEKAKTAFAEIRKEDNYFLRLFDPTRGNTNFWENVCNAVKSQIKSKAKTDDLPEGTKALLGISVGRLLI